MRQLLFVALAAAAAVAHAQTVTTTDAFGNSIVDVLTTDVLGNPLASILETLSSIVTTTTPSTSSTSTSTSVQQVVTVTTAQQGPVGQPAATTFSPGGPTPYTYTTIINGVTTALVDTFTPTNPITNPPTIPATGTILDYSSWLSQYGPTTTSSAGVNGAIDNLRSGVAATLVLGLAVGMGLVLH